MQRTLKTIREAIIGGAIALAVLVLFIGALVKYGGAE
jgi:hypothetical protein